MCLSFFVPEFLQVDGQDTGSCGWSWEQWRPKLVDGLWDYRIMRVEWGGWMRRRVARSAWWISFENCKPERDPSTLHYFVKLWTFLALASLGIFESSSISIPGSPRSVAAREPNPKPLNASFGIYKSSYPLSTDVRPTASSLCLAWDDTLFFRSWPLRSIAASISLARGLYALLASSSSTTLSNSFLNPIPVSNGGKVREEFRYDPWFLRLGVRIIIPRYIKPSTSTPVIAIRGPRAAEAPSGSRLGGSSTDPVRHTNVRMAEINNNIDLGTKKKLVV